MKTLLVTIFCTLLAFVCSDGNKSTLLSSKIIGGQPSNAKYVVTLKRGGSHLGCAVLVTPKHAITSGRLAYRLPSSDFNNTYIKALSLPGKSGRVRYIKDIVYHPMYDNISVDSDANFAIVCLNDSFTLSENLHTISLSSHIVSLKTKCRIVGWGCNHIIQNNTLPDVSKDVKELRVNIIPNQICLMYYPGKHTSHICARATLGLLQYPYVGDVGDPVVTEQEELIGIIIRLGGPPFTPLMFTSLFKYRNFIESVIQI